MARKSQVVRELRPPAESEDAYQVWAYTCKGSAMCVARETGIPFQKIYYWKGAYDWQARRERELIPELRSMLADVKVEVSLGLRDAVSRLRTIIKDGDVDKEAISAARALNELYRSLVLATQPSEEPKLVEAEYRNLDQLPTGQDENWSPADILEANISDHEPGR